MTISDDYFAQFPEFDRKDPTSIPPSSNTATYYWQNNKWCVRQIIQSKRGKVKVGIYATTLDKIPLSVRDQFTLISNVPFVNGVGDEEDEEEPVKEEPVKEEEPAKEEEEPIPEEPAKEEEKPKRKHKRTSEFMEMYNNLSVDEKFDYYERYSKRLHKMKESFRK